PSFQGAPHGSLLLVEPPVPDGRGCSAAVGDYPGAAGAASSCAGAPRSAVVPRAGCRYSRRPGGMRLRQRLCMTAYLRASTARLRANLARSNTRLAWQERLGLAMLAITVLLAGWFAPRLTPLQLLVASSVLIAALAVLLRRGW